MTLAQNGRLVKAARNQLDKEPRSLCRWSNLRMSAIEKKNLIRINVENYSRCTLQSIRKCVLFTS